MCARGTPTPLFQGSGCGFLSAGKWVESETKLEAGLCALYAPPGLRHSGLQDAATSQPLRLPPLPARLRGFHSVPLFCSCIWFCDSFEDTNMLQNSHRSQSRLSCRPLTVIANICLTRCSSAVVTTLSSFKSQVNMIRPLSFQILPSSHMSGQISDLYTHTQQRTHVHGDPEVSRSRSYSPRPLPRL